MTVEGYEFVGAVAFALGLLSFFGVRLFLWRRAGVSLPPWVHGLALGAFLVGAFLVVLDRGVDAFSTTESIIGPLVLPAIVYVFYVTGADKPSSARSAQRGGTSD